VVERCQKFAVYTAVVVQIALAALLAGGNIVGVNLDR